MVTFLTTIALVSKVTVVFPFVRLPWLIYSSSSVLRLWLQEWPGSISLCGHFMFCYSFLLSQRKFRLRRSPQCVFVCERQIFWNTGKYFAKIWTSMTWEVTTI